MSKHNANVRRIVALDNLRSSKFFPKKNKKGVERNESDWQSRKDAEIDILEKRIK